MKTQTIFFINIMTLLALAEGIKEWKAYKLAHNLNFNNEQIEKVKLETWAKNLNNIENHNKAFREKKVSYSMGVNHRDA